MGKKTKTNKKNLGIFRNPSPSNECSKLVGNSFKEIKGKNILSVNIYLRCVLQMPVCQISSADSRCNTSRLSDCERCIPASHTLMHQLVQGTPYATCSTGILCPGRAGCIGHTLCNLLDRDSATTTQACLLDRSGPHRSAAQPGAHLSLMLLSDCRLEPCLSLKKQSQ